MIGLHTFLPRRLTLGQGTDRLSTDGAIRAALQALAAAFQDGTPAGEERSPPGKADSLHQCISGWGLFTCTPQVDGGGEFQGEGKQLWGWELGAGWPEAWAEREGRARKGEGRGPKSVEKVGRKGAVLGPQGFLFSVSLQHPYLPRHHL